MLKDSLDILCPTISCIVNSSLQSGTVPDSYKTAIITPVLKKPSLDRNALKSYRPVSNLPFLSKVLERVVAKQLTQHMSENGLHEPTQSAYKAFHSTETALVKVHNDLLWAMDNQGVALLLLLDLSAAFDTIDHVHLLTRLHEEIGITDVPMKWFKVYLSNRTQCVMVDGVHSSEETLTCGVPQGSVLGPLLFLIYTIPLGRVIRKHGFSLHIYADDTQIYIIIKPVNQKAIEHSAAQIQTCVLDIQSWMTANMLKLNAEKTEVLIVGSRFQLLKFHLEAIWIGNGEVIIQRHSARNLGVMFDCCMTMSAQVDSLTRSTNFHLASIRKVRRLLTQESTTKLVCSLVLSRLDYCNALLYNISGQLCLKLQRVLHSAARLISGSRKYDSVTPLLIQLHWLPIRQRIQYKILLLVFKALHGRAPSYISEMLVPYNPKRALRSTSLSLLCERRARCVTFGDRAFSVCGPRLWNILPNHIRTIESLDSFKKLLKAHLFTEVFFPAK